MMVHHEQRHLNSELLNHERDADFEDLLHLLRIEAEPDSRKVYPELDLPQYYDADDHGNQLGEHSRNGSSRDVHAEAADEYEITCYVYNAGNQHEKEREL